MFWDSVLGGLKVLTFWQTYIAGLEYLAIFLIPLLIFGVLMDQGNGITSALGCLSFFFVPVLQAAALVIMILTISPIIYGTAHDAAWSFPWLLISQAPSSFFKLIGILILVSIGLAFIPILGQLRSFQTFVSGGIILVYLLGMIKYMNPVLSQHHVEIVPNFWIAVGFIVIGSIMSWIGIWVSALISTLLDFVDEGIGVLILLPISSIFGFLPVFMYGAWLGAQIKGYY